MKAAQNILPGAERLRMAQLAVRGNGRFRCLDLEVKRQGYTYTCETLEELRGKYPKDSFFFIAGADCLFFRQLYFGGRGPGREYPAGDGGEKARTGGAVL